MAVGLGGMALLTLLGLLSFNLTAAFGVAIAVGMTFSLVSNATIPFALSMVPAHKAGLGTGIYFSGAAVASSAYGMAISQGITLSAPMGIVLGAIAFLAAAICVLISINPSSA